MTESGMLATLGSCLDPAGTEGGLWSLLVQVRLPCHGSFSPLFDSILAVEALPSCSLKRGLSVWGIDGSSLQFLFWFRNGDHIWFSQKDADHRCQVPAGFCHHTLVQGPLAGI